MASATAPVALQQPAISTRLTSRVVTRYKDFLDLEPAWDELVRQSGATHPFLEHTWIRSWWESFGANSQLHIVVVTEGSATVAIAPLIITTVRMYGMKVRRLGFFYNAHVPRADFIVGRGRDDAYQAIWSRLRGDRDWDLMQLCQLTEESETLVRLHRFAEAGGCRTGLWKSGASPRVPLNADWEAYQATLATKFKSNLRNRFKRIEQVGPVALSTVREGDEVQSALTQGFDLEAAAWKGANGTAITNDPDIEKFYRLFAERAAAKGWLRLNFLKAGGNTVAFDYSLHYQDRVFLQKLGYDPQYSQLSPSNLLLSTTLKQAFENRFVEYDFLGEEAEWKKCWTPEARSNFWLFIFAPTLKGRLLHFLKFRFTPWAKNNRHVQRVAKYISSRKNPVVANSGSANS